MESDTTKCWCGIVATTTSKCKSNLGDPVCKDHEFDED